jgi:hypothetical protein
LSGIGTATEREAACGTTASIGLELGAPGNGALTRATLPALAVVTVGETVSGTLVKTGTTVSSAV